ncbi:MAG: hypothetical protein U1D41_15835 [Nitrosomonas sp.]|uniref:hypothetical protein n=1 Tax=Nitrosomonas sp. TaxID=42353 RepID=UPI002733D547|nr:hypothetical protein [Nitrosomonas sp.]MDP3280744.1 hypothetical protein [Nitrosomonas sp.]MDP3661866.1 hypothetical protein [Nitrosomonas sp.]MDZ4107593.1 hypothetical protein [Nitrosomonas sp.]
MKKNILSILCAVALITPGVQSALAESVAVAGNSIFILDNSAGSKIVVKNLTDGTENTSCLANPNLVLKDAAAVPTDIVIKNGTAVITTYNSTSNATDVMLVDVTSCANSDTVDLSECYATVDDDKLTIPCLKYGDDVISVVLGQRGSSMNYEFESSKPGKSRGHDDDD